MEKEQSVRVPAVKSHSFSLENRQKATLTGVSEVIAFDDGQVVLMTGSGEIALTGKGLHVTRLMLEEGEMTVEGQIDSVFYTQKSAGRRLFRLGGK